jgi:hypothetical protein
MVSFVKLIHPTAMPSDSNTHTSRSWSIVSTHGSVRASAHLRAICSGIPRGPSTRMASRLISYRRSASAATADLMVPSNAAVN